MRRSETTPNSPNLFQRLRTWLSGSADVAVEPDPEAADIETVRRDIDVSLVDMALITHPNAGPTVLLPERLSMLGLDPLYLQTADAAAYRALQDACGQCPKWRRCARDLGRGDATTGLQRYCYNSAAIDDLLIARNSG
jgi:hypothetical protein